MTRDRAERRYERLLALRGQPMPATVECGNKTYSRVQTYKHDFFAATGRYEAEDGSAVVLKIFRPYSYYGIPFGLLSRYQARHEEKVYKLLADTGHVPRWIGRHGKTGFLHEYVPGSDLTPGAKVTLASTSTGGPDPDHAPARHLLPRYQQDAQRTVGDDGRFYLIDFQITWVQPPFPLSILTWPLFYMFKKSDRYHLMKHQKRMFRKSIRRAVLDKHRPLHVKLHRFFADPIRRVRRAYLRRVESEVSSHPEGTERH